MKKYLVYFSNPAFSKRLAKILQDESSDLIPLHCTSSSKNQICQSIIENNFALTNELIGHDKIVGAINLTEEFIELHSQLVDHFHLSGPSLNAVGHFRDKSQLHLLLLKAGLEKHRPTTIITNLEKISQAIKQVSLPVIIKPFQGAKSRGVFKIERPSDLTSEIIELLRQHFESEPSLKNSEQQKILIEEFICGKQITATSYVDHNGKLHTISFAEVIDGRDIGENHQQLIYRTTPISYPKYVELAIHQLLQEIITKSGLKSTFIHPDFIVNDQQIILIELNVRVGGLRRILNHYAHGINLEKFIFQLALGQVPSDNLHQKYSCTGADVWSMQSGTIKKFELPSNDSLVKLDIHFHPGDKYLAPPDGNHHLARFFVSSKNNDSLKIAQQVYQGIQLEIEPD